MSAPAPHAALSRPYMTVDVFTHTALLGNPVAVVLGADGLSEAQMQAFARWTNLSETTFVLQPSAQALAAGADYQLRIFTPAGELAFAGHPTLGSCHAWLAQGGQPRNPEQVLQECKKGLIAIGCNAQGALFFEAPSLDSQEVSEEELTPVLQALGLAREQVLVARSLHNGSPWLGLLLDHPDTMLGVEPDFAALRKLDAKAGLAAIYEEEEDAPLIGRSSREARAFAKQAEEAVQEKVIPAQPRLEVRALIGETASEDPVTGSLNAALAQWLTGEGLLQTPYIAAQGICVGRDGQVHVQTAANGKLWVGGHTVTVTSGRVLL
ncbi:PhzF family phenazine biosynthesis protein [Comamonas testosteroni]|nr:PhzF family phenazine biosynthesis protein [Comamonas testosteroni]WEE78244.1 PhzF family phenazine biosynthesis protein [Comamonas testosteroni]